MDTQMLIKSVHYELNMFYLLKNVALILLMGFLIPTVLQSVEDDSNAIETAELRPACIEALTIGDTTWSYTRDEDFQGGEYESY